MKVIFNVLHNKSHLWLSLRFTNTFLIIQKFQKLSKVLGVEENVTIKGQHKGIPWQWWNSCAPWQVVSQNTQGKVQGTPHNTQRTHVKLVKVCRTHQCPFPGGDTVLGRMLSRGKLGRVPRPSLAIWCFAMFYESIKNVLDYRFNR